MIHLTARDLAKLPRHGPEMAQDATRARRTNRPNHRSEAEIKREVLKALRISGYFAIRINSGATFGETRRRKWAVMNAAPGTADILVLIKNGSCFYPTWLECKTIIGKQSQAQMDFERAVNREGHRYAVVRSVEDALKACMTAMLTEAF